MTLTERGGKVSALEEVTGALVLLVEVHGPPSVKAGEESSQSGGSGWREQEVDVVVHQAIAVNLDVFFVSYFGGPFEITTLVEACSKDTSLIDSTCDYMMNYVLDDESGQARHGESAKK